MEQDSFTVDAMHVAVPHAAGIDVHKMELTATVRLCSPGWCRYWSRSRRRGRRLRLQ